MEIIITGDFCPVHRALDFAEGNHIFDSSLLEMIQNADCSITNLECPLTHSPNAINKTGPALKADKATIRILKNAGFDLVTLANNHILDFGAQGLIDTIQVLEQNKIGYVGAGKHSDEISTIYQKKDDLTIAIVNICENEWSTSNFNGYAAHGLDPMINFNDIQTAASKADKVVVIHHGGHEMYELPSPRMKKLFRFFVDAGAHAVINHHTHCVSGFEVYKNAPIFYSLGNFVFDSPYYKDNIWNYGLVVKLKIVKEKIDFDFKVFEQFNHEPIVRLLDKHPLYGRIKELNNHIGNDAVLAHKFEEFIETKQKMYNSYLEPFKNKYRMALKNRGLVPSAWNPRKRLYLKNLISCESHREIILNILENEISHS